MTTKPPLCVDLDGTLVYTDVLIETAIKSLKEKPWLIFLFPVWLARGKAYLKQKISQQTQVDVVSLPYNQPLLNWLKEEHAQGRTLALVTATDQSIAQRVANHIKLFTHVIGSDGTQNVSGHTKAKVLSAKFGNKQFVYAGNAPVDVSVWKSAAAAIVVNASKTIERAAASVAPIEKIFPPLAWSWHTIVRALRIHQWVKNLLLFVPVIAGHHLQDASLVLQAAVAFLAFSSMASAIYLMNDLFDLEADRNHHTKKHRPLAAGELQPLTAIVLGLALVSISLLLTEFWLPMKFYAILGAYVGINLAYSSFLKQIPLLDVITLASLYVLRIFGGSFATGIVTSSWLFIFALFLFVSLALVKRFTELTNLIQQNKTHAHGRGYTSADRGPLATIGIVSGYLSLLVLALYIASDTVTTLYQTPEILWLSIPALLFWISRIWLLAYRGQLHEDPIAFAIRDVTSYVVCIVIFTAAIFAT